MSLISGYPRSLIPCSRRVGGLVDRELGLDFQRMNLYQNRRNRFDDIENDVVRSLDTDPSLRLQVNCQSVCDPIPIYCLEKVADRLISSDESGDVHVVPGWFNNYEIKREGQGSEDYFIEGVHVSDSGAIYSIKHAKGKLLTGSGNGLCCVLDLSSLELIREYDCHTKSVKRVDSFNGDVFVSCSRDNSINVYDLRVKQPYPVNRIDKAHSTSDSVIVHSSNRKKSASWNCTPSCSVTDVVFVDDVTLISSGAADGLIKQWDLRVTYKCMKKYHPVSIIEYPGVNTTRGYGCLKVASTKLLASSLHNDIFQFDLGSMKLETTYKSPSKLSYYTKLDTSSDGRYLASGSEENKVSIFELSNSYSSEQLEVHEPLHTLVHSDDDTFPVCCAAFSPSDDMMVTTGGDSSFVRKWIPEIYLRKDFSKKHLAESNMPPLKTEFTYLRRRKESTSYYDSPVSSPSSLHCSLQRQLRLEAFPNYIVDGMRLPHVQPRIKIKLRKLDCSINWLRSPDSIACKKRVIETTPKAKATRKRKRFYDESLSPKILEFFKLTSSE